MLGVDETNTSCFIVDYDDNDYTLGPPPIREPGAFNGATVQMHFHMGVSLLNVCIVMVIYLR